MNQVLVKAGAVALILLLACQAQTNSIPQGIYFTTTKLQDTWFCKLYGCKNDGIYVGKSRSSEDWISYRPETKQDQGIKKDYRQFTLNVLRNPQKQINSVALQTPVTTASRGLADQEMDYIRDWIKLMIGVDVPWQKIFKAQDGARDAMRGPQQRTKQCTDDLNTKDIECVNDISLYIMQRGMSNTKTPKTFTIFWKYIYSGGYKDNATDDWMYIGIAEKPPIRF